MRPCGAGALSLRTVLNQWRPIGAALPTSRFCRPRTHRSRFLFLQPHGLRLEVCSVGTPAQLHLVPAGGDSRCARCPPLPCVPPASLGFRSLVKVKVAQSCPTLCDPMDYTVQGILQARILEWVAFPSPGDLPNPGMNPGLPHCGGILHQLSHQRSLRILEWAAFPSPGDLPNPGMNPGLLHCRQVLHQLSPQVWSLGTRENVRFHFRLCFPGEPRL